MRKLEIRNLSMTYRNGPSVLNNISFSIDKNEIFSVIGTSGCGKTTLLRCIAGLSLFQSGDALIDDISISDIPREKRNISMVFQNYYLYPHLTIYQNLAQVLIEKKFKRDEIDNKINEVSNLFGFREILAERPRTLSGGQRQKVALARALLKESNLVLLDEPLASIDEKFRMKLLHKLREYHKLFNCPFLYVTHNKREALNISNKVMVIKDGRVSTISTPYDLVKNPDNIYSARFFSNLPLNEFPAKVIDSNHVDLLGNIIKVDNINPNFTEKDVLLTINSEFLNLGNDGIRAEIKGISSLGDKYLYELKVSNFEQKYHALSDKLYNVNDDCYINISNENWNVYSNLFEERVSGFTKINYVPLKYEYKNDLIELSFLGIKYNLTQEYLDYILPFENKKIYLKINEYNFNNKGLGIKLCGKVKKIFEEYIWVDFNGYGIYFSRNDEHIGDDYITWLDFDTLGIVNEDNDYLSIACPVSNNQIINYELTYKKDKNYKKIYPIYEEFLGTNNISFFKIKNDKNVYMIKGNKSIYSSKKIYIKW